MADVFLSYASEDRGRVKPLAEALETAGFTVWWDRLIEPGSSFDREIEEELSSASCVVVVWSKISVNSNWVREEADEGLQRGILIPVRIDECQVPLGFRRSQSADLVGWPSSKKDLTPLTQKITRVIGKHLAMPEREPTGNMRRYAVFASVLLILSLATGFIFRDTLALALLLNAPSLFVGKPVEQTIGFTTAPDGTRIAYATSGEGPPILYVLGFWTHLENGQSSPFYDTDGLIAMSSREHLFVRYDGRGSGLSDRGVVDFSLQARVSDIEAVVEALDLDQFALFAVSGGGPAAIDFVAKHPERVSRLVLAGCIAKPGWDDVARDAFLKQLDLYEVAWDRPEVSNMHAELLLRPHATEVSRSFLGEMLRRAADGEDVKSFLSSSIDMDVEKQASQIRVPTLVIHAVDDAIVPIDMGRRLASLIPQASFEVVEGGHLASSASTPATRKLALDFLSAERQAK